MGSGGDRSAAFICCLALILDPHRLLLVQEAVAGEITPQVRGTGGFGYDPLFLLPHLGRTMAELSGEEKDRISHRGRALRRARRLFEAENGA